LEQKEVCDFSPLEQRRKEGRKLKMYGFD